MNMRASGAPATAKNTALAATLTHLLGPMDKGQEETVGWLEAT